VGKTTGAETRLLPRTLTAQMEGMDLSILVLAAWNLVLHRYSGQEDILIGTSMAGDQATANVVVLRTSVAGNPRCRELVDRVRSARTAAMQHKELPFQYLLAELCPAPDPAYHPLVQMFFTRGAGLGPAGFDLRLCLFDNQEGPAIRLEYAFDLFDRPTIQRMLQHLEIALQSLTAAPERPLSMVSILTAAESNLVLREWNRTERDYPREKTLIQLFEEQAARTPGAVALVCGGSRLTYRELSERSTRVAKRLRALGVGNEARVGICLERSEEMVAGILGTLQAGGAYVPLDPAYPKAHRTPDCAYC